MPKRTDRGQVAESKQVEAIVQRLNAIINLLSRAQDPQAPISDRIRLLKDSGLSNAEVANIVGKSATYVFVVSSRTGRKKKPSAKRRKGGAK